MCKTKENVWNMLFALNIKFIALTNFRGNLITEYFKDKHQGRSQYCIEFLCVIYQHNIIVQSNHAKLNNRGQSALLYCLHLTFDIISINSYISVWKILCHQTAHHLYKLLILLKISHDLQFSVQSIEFTQNRHISFTSILWTLTVLHL